MKFNQIILSLLDFLWPYTVKKRLPIFPSLAVMSLTKLSLAGNNLIFTGQGEIV